jgi:hypothetical protein
MVQTLTLGHKRNTHCVCTETWCEFLFCSTEGNICKQRILKIKMICYISEHKSHTQILTYLHKLAMSSQVIWSYV